MAYCNISQSVILAVSILSSFLISAHADTVTLKDGTTLEGNIRSESDKQLVIEVQHAGGTIVTTRTVEKSEVTAIKRIPAAERMERDQARTYAELQKIQLDPNNSLTLPQYDAAIQKFQFFLAMYPQSPNAKAVTDQLAAWQADRQKVAGGQAKYRGTWMTADQAAQLINRGRMEQMLETGRAAFGRGQFVVALQQIDALAKLTGSEGLPAEATTIRTEAVSKLLESSRRSRAQLDAEVKAETDHLAKAQENLAKMKAELAKHQADQPASGVNVGGAIIGPTPLGSGGATVIQNGNVVTRGKPGTFIVPGGPSDATLNVGNATPYVSLVMKAQLEVNESARRLARLENERSQVDLRIAELQAR